MIDACCAWIGGHLGANRILFVGPDTHRHATILASRGHEVIHAARDAAVGCKHLPWDEQGPLPPLPEMDLCICLHAALPRLGDSEGLLAELCACAPRVLVSATPPGELGVAHDNALPFQRWALLFAQQGYAGTDLPLQHLDPWLYAIYNNPFAPNNSYGLFTCFSNALTNQSRPMRFRRVVAQLPWP